MLTWPLKQLGPYWNKTSKQCPDDTVTQERSRPFERLCFHCSKSQNHAKMVWLTENICMQMLETNQRCSANRIISKPSTVLKALSSETLVIHSPVSRPPACSEARFIPPCSPQVAAPSLLPLSLEGGQPYRPGKPDGRAGQLIIRNIRT